MSREQKAVQRLYGKLLSLYPHAFREHFGESMQQTFKDLYKERKRQTQQGVFGFVLWMFLDTAVGVIREHLLSISPGDIMRTLLKTFGLSALISLLLILPFIIMEVVNRRNYNEDFPFFLFFVMWFNLLAISLILLPILLSRQTASQDAASPPSGQGNTLLTNPGRAAIVSILLFLSPGILPLLDAVGWLSADRLINGPNPEVTYLPGMFISLGLFSLPVAAGMIAGRPVARTRRAGGSLFAHPINLIIIVFLVSTFAFGLASLIIDQWPCFVGVPVCD